VERPEHSGRWTLTAREPPSATSDRVYIELGKDVPEVSEQKAVVRWATRFRDWADGEIAYLDANPPLSCYAALWDWHDRFSRSGGSPCAARVAGPLGRSDSARTEGPAVQWTTVERGAAARHGDAGSPVLDVRAS
jgi:hypothetical protein